MNENKFLQYDGTIEVIDNQRHIMTKKIIKDILTVKNNDIGLGFLSYILVIISIILFVVGIILFFYAGWLICLISILIFYFSFKSRNESKEKNLNIKNDAFTFHIEKAICSEIFDNDSYDLMLFKGKEYSTMAARDSKVNDEYYLLFINEKSPSIAFKTSDWTLDSEVEKFLVQ